MIEKHRLREKLSPLPWLTQLNHSNLLIFRIDMSEGYDREHLVTQQDPAITSILVLTMYLLFIIVYLLLRKYDLDKKYPQIVKDLADRKGKSS